MVKRRLTPEQIINQLREAEVELGRGMKVPGVCKKLVADLSLDNAILRQATKGNSSAR